MRLLITTHVWEPESGVPQRRWAWLSSALTSSGHHVEVVAPPPHYPTGRLQSTDAAHGAWRNGPGNNGEHVWRTAYVPHNRGLLLRLVDEFVAMVTGLWVLRRRIHVNRPDLLVATVPPLPAAITAAIMGRAFRIPVLLDVRDTWPDLLEHLADARDQSGRREGRHLRGFLFRGLSAIAKRALTWAMLSSAGVVTTSTRFAQRLLTRGVRRATCIYNVASLPTQSLPSPPVSSRTLNILYAGTAGRAQELETALAAIAGARQMGADIRFRAIGGGAHMRTLRRKAEELGLPVEFLKRVPHGEMASHYKWADTVLVQLQSWVALEEAIPSKLFEVMAYGRHITASLNGEAAEIVRESGSGDVVPAQDGPALEKLLLRLYNDRTKLMVKGRGADWLANNAKAGTMQSQFLEFVQEVATGSEPEKRLRR